MKEEFYPFWAVFKDYYGTKRAWINSEEKLREVYDKNET